MEERCVCCAAVIPEGQQVCPECLASVPYETKPKERNQKMSGKRDKQIRRIAKRLWRFQLYEWHRNKPSRWRIFKYLKWKKSMPRYADEEKQIKSIAKRRCKHG